MPSVFRRLRRPRIRASFLRNPETSSENSDRQHYGYDIPSSTETYSDDVNSDFLRQVKRDLMESESKNLSDFIVPDNHMYPHH